MDNQPGSWLVNLLRKFSITSGGGDRQSEGNRWRSKSSNEYINKGHGKSFSINTKHRRVNKQTKKNQSRETRWVKGVTVVRGKPLKSQWDDGGEASPAGRGRTRRVGGPWRPECRTGKDSSRCWGPCASRSVSVTNGRRRRGFCGDGGRKVPLSGRVLTHTGQVGVSEAEKASLDGPSRVFRRSQILCLPPPLSFFRVRWEWILLWLRCSGGFPPNPPLRSSEQLRKTV